MVTVQLEPEQTDTITASTIRNLYFDIISNLDCGNLVFADNREEDLIATQSFMKSLAEVHNYFVTEEHYI